MVASVVSYKMTPTCAALNLALSFDLEGRLYRVNRDSWTVPSTPDLLTVSLLPSATVPLQGGCRYSGSHLFYARG